MPSMEPCGVLRLNLWPGRCRRDMARNSPLKPFLLVQSVIQAVNAKPYFPVDSFRKRHHAGLCDQAFFRWGT
jgi:hypothetical protein